MATQPKIYIINAHRRSRAQRQVEVAVRCLRFCRVSKGLIWLCGHMEFQEAKYK